jgi:N-acetylmuramoyl-L-alanine amidase
MKRYIFISAMAVSFLGGLLSGKSAFGGEANAGLIHSPVSEQKCLADNIYFEARNQVHRGMIAVALVTRNRVLDSRFPHSFCEVVKQGPERPSWKQNGTMVPLRHRCQFSWYCDGKADEIYYHDTEVYQLAVAIAFKVYNNDFYDFTDGATHYHADYVKPEWASTKTKTMKIDQHIFYRWEK